MDRSLLSVHSQLQCQVLVFSSLQDTSVGVKAYSINQGMVAVTSV